jgi:hypothetical protein
MLRFSSEFQELWESGLVRVPITAIPITDTGIIPTGITTGHIPTMGITEEGHTTGITGIECITATIVIITMVAIGRTKGTRGTRVTRTNNEALSVRQVFSHSHDAVIRVYDDAGSVIETHEHKGDFKEIVSSARVCIRPE